MMNEYPNENELLEAIERFRIEHNEELEVLKLVERQRDGDFVEAEFGACWATDAFMPSDEGGSVANCP